VDPLTKAGWRAILFIAFGAVFILSCLGFIVHAYVSFSGRRVQFALLRTVGLTQFQIGTVVLLEQVFVIATGMALGAWMGQNLGAIIMPFIANDDFGSQVLPPFVTEISWIALIGTYAAMILVFTAITFSMIWFVRRISVVTTLRIGEN
jgi:ABC-type antimicrobial peptide transport system permease subunit